MRRKLEAARPRHDLKRGAGGLADIEFIVQYLQLLHAASQPDLLRPNIWDALAALRRHRIITPTYCTDLISGYEFLRTIEGRLRLIHNRNVSVIPEDRGEIERLARRLSEEAVASTDAVTSFIAEADSKMRRTREIFEQIVAEKAAD